MSKPRMPMSTSNLAGPVDAREVTGRELPAILLKAREERSQRLMMVYALTGLFFMVLPGTFLGVWNLIFISGQRGGNISPAWIQAHGHAQIFGWIGTFILGIGFYSIPKMIGGKPQLAWRGWTAWVLWTAGALLRWITGVYLWHWRATLPLSAAFEFCAFLIFLWSVSRHRSADRQGSGGKVPVWVLSVLVGTFGLAGGLVMNLAAAASVSINGSTPTYSSGFESRLLTMLLFGFIVPTIWGFSARWLPVFLGLEPVNEALLRGALVLNLSGVALAQVGFKHVAPWLFVVAAVASVSAFHILWPAERPVKTLGIHPSFWLPSWSALPWSAICELRAVTVFAANLLLTFKQPPPHLGKAIVAPTAV
jgi:uncharacterized protein involved in response to NO